ncbi:MAG: DUF523 domain-containing protein [Deltaproteobacteria bacterium]|nr:DUF523 domain-containing protein [Deltaproteobacteria bacterium]
MKKILVSACLLGQRVRHDAEVILMDDPYIGKLAEMGLLVPFCPEVEGGMGVPREPLEIKGDTFWRSGSVTRVLNIKGEDLTSVILKGAEAGLDLVRKEKIGYGLLKDLSPSCGHSEVFDGSFSSTKIKGKGALASLLEKQGVMLFTERQSGILYHRVIDELLNPEKKGFGRS